MSSVRIITQIRIMILIIMLSLCHLVFSDSLKIGVPVSGLPISEKINTDQGPYYYGFCIDIMNSICNRLHQTCVYSQITLDKPFELLDSGQIDLLILPAPYQFSTLKNYSVSVPYAVSKFQFVALQNSPINEIAEIKNKQIGVVKTTFYDLLLRTEFAKLNQIIPFDTMPNLLSALAQGNVDVIAVNNAVAFNMLNHNVYNIKLIGDNIPIGDGYGIIGLLNKQELIEEINKAILSIQKDGTYISIYKKYYSE